MSIQMDIPFDSCSITFNADGTSPQNGPAAAANRLGFTTRGSLALLFAVLDDLLTAVVAGGAHMVPQVHFTRAGLDGNRRSRQRIVCAPHVAPGGGLLVLLNCHGVTPSVSTYFRFATVRAERSERRRNFMSV